MKIENRISNICKVMSSASLLVMMVHSSVIAKEDTPTNKKTSAMELIEEVLVYGTKRSAAESAQSVPGQVAAFGASQLEARQVITLEDMTMTTPNVQLDGPGTSPGVANFTIRGQGINSSIPSIDPTVGVFVDGIYLGTTYGVITDVFDIESIEIHKGPQGVLFGRNVSAGAVLLRSARPNGETSVKGKVGIETGLQYTAALSVQGSLVEDKIAAKVSVQYKKDDGYFENLTVGRDIGKEETIIIRPIVVLTPSESLEVTIIWDHGKMTGDGPVTQASAGFTPLAPSKKIETVINNPGFVDLLWNQVTMETNWDVGNGRITNIFGYRKLSNKSSGDIDSTALDLFDIGTNVQHKQVSNELRYSGMMMTGWELTSGLYYYEADLDYEETRSLIFNTIQIGGGGVQNHRTLGVFVNNYIDLSDNLVLQAGLRYSDEKKVAAVHPLGSCTIELVCGTANEGNKKWTNWSPKVGLNWAVGEDISVYGHFARSYRAGGYNFRSPRPDLVAFDPERVDSFELGVKSMLMDNRVRFNGAIFINKINNMQREVNLSHPVIGIFQDIANTASGEIKGLEVDTTVLVNNALAINASVGYLDFKYTDILVDLSGDGIIDQTDFGLRLPRLAKWTLNFGVTYDIELSKGTLVARADYAYRSSAAMNDRNNALFNSYDLVNAGLTFEHADGNWSLSVYGKNLTNTAFLGGVSPLPFASLGGSYLSPLKKGRRYGAELRFNF